MLEAQEKEEAARQIQAVVRGKQTRARRRDGAEGEGENVDRKDSFSSDFYATTDHAAKPPQQVTSGVGLFEKSEAGTPSAAWLYRGPEAEQLQVQKSRAAQKLVSDNFVGFYEKSEVGKASAAWLYRGPVAERLRSEGQ